MKRLNPDTGKPFVRGDTRADGFLFWQYQRKLRPDGYKTESWLNPESFHKNSENLRICRIKYFEADIERDKKRRSEYRKKNPDKVNARTAKRRAKKIQRTPKWLTKDQLFQISLFYLEAKQLSKMTGIQHEVDHIVPLQGFSVSGLHVPWNLQVIPKLNNRKKSNSYSDNS